MSKAPVSPPFIWSPGTRALPSGLRYSRCPDASGAERIRCRLLYTSPSPPEEALAALLERTAAEGVRLLIPRMETAELLEEGPEGSTFVYDGCRIALPLLGDRQRENAVTAVEAARVCLPGLSSRDIEQGLASVRMPCRQELIRREPPLLLDGAHNPHGVGALAETVQSLWGKGRITLLIGMLADKETARCAALLAPLCRRAVCCTPRGPRRCV